MRPFLFATGIENSYPVIALPDGSPHRVDELEKTRASVDDPRPREEAAWVFLLAALAFFLAEQALAASRWRVVP